MRHTRLIALLLGIALTLTTLAADKLAVAEPVARGRISAEDVETLWGILESCIQSDEYTLISRAALKQMMTEIGLADSSGLVDMTDAQKAALGKLKGVKYILISEIGKLGSKFNCTMRIIDASTGEIDTARTANIRVKDLDELADRIEGALEKLLSDDKALHASALLTPVIQIQPAPTYLKGEFNARLEQALISNGVQLQNLKTVDKILKNNNMDNLDELEPKMYVKIGRLLEVQKLIQATITRFDIVNTPFYVAETGAKGVIRTGNTEGYIRIIDTKTGRIAGSIPFDVKFDFRGISRQITQTWTLDDYGKYMLKVVIPQQILPQLLAVKGLNLNP